ncbi:hypothetical protein [Marinicella litoralis]|uniref:Uncharacterized protein n=1 Tax=Marinicella litoralis TaxID=644220 RepID=A0A4V3DI30_9GAMM|nr:hypothetical protein [Marinicella litoralis]TDR20491.1 hypothetical protein C8D91_1465 [Marinicella litoralis]
MFFLMLTLVSGFVQGSPNCDVIYVHGFESGGPTTEVCEAPIIADMGMHTVSHGDTFVYQPQISGEVVLCRKDMGHDEVNVDSVSGLITWDTSELLFGRGFYIRIKCSNYHGSAWASMVVHVDKSGSSQLRVAGENGVSPFIAVAASEMQGGDTVVFPDGLYPVSVSQDESFENALKTTTDVPSNGSADQFSTIMAASPGGVLISGAAHDGIPKQKNAIQMASSNYVALVGFKIADVLRESFTSSNGNHLLVEFIGTAGAGTNNLPCSNFIEAREGWCSKAGMRANNGTPLFQANYDWGHNRYGIMTRSTTASITRRSFVRLDEHRGDQPYGGFSDYCDQAHLSQDNVVFDSLAIAAPHYKNYAGLSAFPATGCENMVSELKVKGLMAVNNKLSLSLMDSQAGVDNEWVNIVSYDSEATCTPQGNRCAAPLLQSDKILNVRESFFGQARAFNNNISGPPAFGEEIILQENVTLFDVFDETDQGSPPRYLPESLLYFSGKSDTFHGDPGFQEMTTVRRWPISGEDIMAASMQSYFNSAAFKVGGGTVAVDGNRGAVAEGETMSEYFWAYMDPLIPPLVVRVKDLGATHRIAWEHLSSHRRTSVIGWKVVCTSSGNTTLVILDENQLSYEHPAGSCTSYAVKTMYFAGESGIAYSEVPVQ